jgi:hypothetical protein
MLDDIRLYLTDHGLKADVLWSTDPSGEDRRPLVVSVTCRDATGSIL